MADWK